MRAVTILAIVVLVTASCGGATSSGLPTVEIVSLDVSGNIAILEFTVGDESGPVNVVIDWGDGTQESLIGTGEQAATHDYEAGLGQVVVTVTATGDDGQSAQASRAVTVSSSTTTSTSTTASSTTTSTSAPTVTSTTSAAGTSTTTPRATTSLPPQPTELVFDLTIGNSEGAQGVVVPAGADGFVDNVATQVQLQATTSGSEGTVSAESDVQWVIAEEAWSRLGPQPALSALMDYSYDVELVTGPNPGRSATFDFIIFGTILEQRAEGTGDLVTIEAGDHEQLTNDGQTGFGFILAADATGPISITLRTVCVATPGSNIFQIGEMSQCTAALRPTIALTLTTNDDV